MEYTVNGSEKAENGDDLNGFLIFSDKTIVPVVVPIARKGSIFKNAIEKFAEEFTENNPLIIENKTVIGFSTDAAAAENYLELSSEPSESIEQSGSEGSPLEERRKKHLEVRRENAIQSYIKSGMKKEVAEEMADKLVKGLGK